MKAITQKGSRDGQNGQNVSYTLEHLAENGKLVISLIGDPGTQILIGVLSEVVAACSRGTVTAIDARAIAGAQLAEDLAAELRSLSLAIVSRSATPALTRGHSAWGN